MFFIEFIPTTMLQNLRCISNMTSKLEDWELLTLRERLTPKDVDLKFQESNKKPESGSYELKPGIIRIAAADPFNGEDDENPYKHLEKLKQQRRNEDIDEAWERLDDMLTQGPLLGVTPNVHIHIFYFGLTLEAFEKVNITPGGSLLSWTWSEANKILLDICMACKSNRERKDDGVMAPEDHMITVSYDEEDYGSFAPQEETKSDYKSLASAKPLTKFEKMSWMPVEFGDTLKCAGPLPTEDLVEEEELFPPEVPLRKSDDSQDTGEVLQKLFQEEELDSDLVSEVKQVIVVKPESSLTEEVIVQLPAEESSTRISCSINKEVFNNIHYAMEAKEPLNLDLEGENEGFFSEEATNATNELEQNIEETRDIPTEPLGNLNQQEAPDVELKPLPDGLRYEFLGKDKTYPVVINDELSPEEVERLLEVLRKHKKIIGYSLADLKGISPAFCTHRIPMEEDHKPVVENQRSLSNEMRSMAILDSFKSLFTQMITIKLPLHVPTELSPIGECLLDFVMRLLLSKDFIEDIMEVFMDDFSVHGTSFDHCLKNLEKVLKRCEEKRIVLGDIISEKGIEVDKAKIETVEKLPSPTDVKSLRRFLAHAGFYRRFIKDLSKIAKPLTYLLQKDISFEFTEECEVAFRKIKELLISAPIIQPPDWNLPFEIMCDASDYAVGAVLGKERTEKYMPFIMPQDS
ncbi:hypothetical protein U9M48_013369 [Paspalum notatum var. saurae]|uniref:Reverse transcriptase/retrotransposon-derived protein RNase H-like domain-containing protein n=1 Tax=Paspalum notatum var. saurae TaxID=547442 RepID=A0AAQ3WJC7_PASNO